MLIQGLQGLTLLDYPGEAACTVFTAGCNFRCPFCHNASLVIDRGDWGRLSEEEVFSFLKRRRRVLDGVCITGGEPLLWEDLEPFIRGIKELGYKVKLDTNGSRPKRLKRLLREGLLDYVAMDVKNSKENYGKTIGIMDYDLTQVCESVECLTSGDAPYEFRTTVVRELHRLSDFVSIAKWIKGARAYYLQAFKASGDLLSEGLHGYDRRIMEQALAVVREGVPTAELRGL